MYLPNYNNLQPQSIIKTELMLPTIKTSFDYFLNYTKENIFNIKTFKILLRSNIVEERFNGLHIANINKKEEFIDFGVLQ